MSISQDTLQLDLNTTYKVTVPNLLDKPDMSFALRIRRGEYGVNIIDVEAKYIGSSGGNHKTFCISRHEPMASMRRMLEQEAKILDTNIVTVIQTLLIKLVTETNQPLHLGA